MQYPAFRGIKIGDFGNYENNFVRGKLYFLIFTKDVFGLTEFQKNRYGKGFKRTMERNEDAIVMDHGVLSNANVTNFSYVMGLQCKICSLKKVVEAKLNNFSF